MIAIDPGLRVAGTAEFDNGTLVSARLVKTDFPEEMALRLEDMAKSHFPVVCEKMHVYGKALFAAKHLIDLSILAGWVRPDAMYTYAQWAGSLKEDQLWHRILSRLSDDEKAILPPYLGPHKDVLAAVGIGLHHLGRLKPRKGY